MHKQQEISATAEGLGREPALERRQARLHAPQDVVRLRGSVKIEHTLATARRGEALEAVQGASVRELARRAHRQPGDAAGEGRRAGDLPLGLAGGGRCERLAVRCTPTSRCTRCPRVPTVVKRINNALHARRPDPDMEARRQERRHRLVRADRRGRRVRLRRRAERLRADEGDDRGRRRRRALRGPARLGQEMRPHGRQGAGADAGSGAEARSPRASPPTSWACRPCCSRAPTRKPPTSSPPTWTRTTSPSSPASAPRRASTRRARASTRRCRAGLAYAEYADMVWCETGTPDLGFARKFAEGIQQEVPGQDAGLQLLAVVQLEAQPRRRDDRQVPARARRDGLQVPVHHAGRLPRAQLLDVRARLRLRAQQHDAPSSSCSRRSSPPPRRASPRSSTSARSAPATSTRSPRSSPAARPRPPRCTARPRTSSSSATTPPCPEGEEGRLM